MADVATKSKKGKAGRVRQGTGPRMQEHVGESCDGNIPKVIFGELPSVGGCFAGRRLPASLPGDVPMAGSTSDGPRAPVGSQPPRPVGEKRGSPSVNPPDHNKCHTARPPSMGRIGTSQDKQVT